MTSARHFLIVAGFLGAGSLAAALLIHGGALTAPGREGAALTDAGAAEYRELERLERIVPTGRPGNDGLWRAYLDVFEKQREQGHLDVAIRVLYDAYGAALESRIWESMLAVGDAFMAAGRAPGNAAGAQMNARQSYVTALVRARRDRSVEGALRSAEAFRQLPDPDLVEQCLHIAGLLATGHEHAEQRVRDARERWAARQPVTDF